MSTLATTQALVWFAIQVLQSLACSLCITQQRFNPQSFICILGSYGVILARSELNVLHKPSFCWKCTLLPQLGHSSMAP